MKNKRVVVREWGGAVERKMKKGEEMMMMMVLEESDWEQGRKRVHPLRERSSVQRKKKRGKGEEG